MTNLKDKLTNIFAYAIVIATAADTYIKAIGDQEINWYNFGMAIIVAVISYLTGKKADGTKKAI